MQYAAELRRFRFIFFDPVAPMYQWRIQEGGGLTGVATPSLLGCILKVIFAIFGSSTSLSFGSSTSLSWLENVRLGSHPPVRIFFNPPLCTALSCTLSLFFYFMSKGHMHLYYIHISYEVPLQNIVCYLYQQCLLSENNASSACALCRNTHK